MDTPFKPRAQILLQLGEQLIKNENIAILELVKNSYDADAKTAKVVLNRVDDPENGYIEIIDDGLGMNLDTITNKWMEPGNTHKKSIVENNERSPLGRLPIGEKGIGRFGVHKLGKTIQLISKQAGFKEIVLEIDWTKFETAEYLNDVNIHIEEREPKHFAEGKTGTYIKVGKLSSAWTRGMVRDLYRSLVTLNSPFDSDKSFKAKLYIDKSEWLDDILTFEDIKDYALFECSAKVSGNYITYFNYSFKPYEGMKGRGIFGRSKEITDNISLQKRIRKDGKNTLEDIDLSKYEIGEIAVQLYAFDRDSIVNRFIKDSRALAKYLDENGGIYVLRDGIRVLDYGEPGNDWLDLDIKRVNDPSKRISNNIVLGAVYLSRSSSASLKEKANREGFIEDEAYLCFRDAVNCVLELFSTHRNIDKDNYKKTLTGEDREPLANDILNIRKIVEESNIEASVKERIEKALKKAEFDIEELKQRYIKTANAGMSYGIVIHEIEKVIDDLRIAVNEVKSSPKVLFLAEHLSLLINSYADLLRNKKFSSNDLKDIVNRALFSVEYRLSAHNVIVENLTNTYNGTSEIKCIPNLIVGAIINIIDNSIYWTTYAKVPIKRLYISLSDEINGYISIVIADNGIGYQLSGEEAIKPFVSLKNNGIGLGLNIVNEIMLAQNGELVFPRKGDVSLPKEYEHGAVTLLAFKKEDK